MTEIMMRTLRQVAIVLVLSAPAVPASADPLEEVGTYEHLDPGAMVAQAARFEHGEGIRRNLQLALGLYCHAARFGSVEARYRLGWMIANGRGVARNEAMAAALFAQAADRGHEQSDRLLPYFRRGSVTMPSCLDPVPSPSLRFSTDLAIPRATAMSTSSPAAERTPLRTASTDRN